MIFGILIGAFLMWLWMDWRRFNLLCDVVSMCVKGTTVDEICDWAINRMK